MSATFSDDDGAVPRVGIAAAARLAARWLGLAATPSFALMALLAGVFGGGHMHGSPGGGMGAMYLLMSVFHAGPWLGLIAGSSR